MRRINRLAALRRRRRAARDAGRRRRAFPTATPSSRRCASATATGRRADPRQSRLDRDQRHAIPAAARARSTSWCAAATSPGSASCSAKRRTARHRRTRTATRRLILCRPARLDRGRRRMLLARRANPELGQPQRRDAADRRGPAPRHPDGAPAAQQGRQSEPDRQSRRQFARSTMPGRTRARRWRSCESCDQPMAAQVQAFRTRWPTAS